MANSRGDSTPHCTAPQHTYPYHHTQRQQQHTPTPHTQLVTLTRASHHTRTHHLLPSCAPSCLHLLPFSPRPPPSSLPLSRPVPSFPLPSLHRFLFPFPALPSPIPCFHADVSPFPTQHVRLEMRVNIFSLHHHLPELEVATNVCPLFLSDKRFSTSAH